MKTANWIEEFKRLRELGGFTRHGKVDWVAIEETIKKYIKNQRAGGCNTRLEDNIACLAHPSY